MKITKRDKSDERLILIAMIVDKIVLGRIAAKWQSPGLFNNDWSNRIGSWCVKYYQKYDKAPQSYIQNIYHKWSSKNDNKELINLIEDFLSSLSNEYEALEKESNSDFILDTAGKYFNQLRIEKLKTDIEDDLENGDADAANSKIVNFNTFELGCGEGIDIFQDVEAIKEAFAEKKESIIEYPGDLGTFFGSALERDGFIAIMAPDKRGKSYVLQDMAFRGALQRRKVAYFEAGDNSRKQIMRRLMIKVAGRPLKASRLEKDADGRLVPVPSKVPTKIKFQEGDEHAQLITDKRVYTDDLSWQFCYQKCQEILKNQIRSHQPYFKLSVHVNSSLSVAKIKSILETWAMDDWTPDIIVIDYADIMDMTYQGLEGRERINETWKQLRGLSQKYHCLVITATQSDANAYSAKIIKQENFSDDKRKMAHVTGMFGLNCTDDEKARGIMRFNWIVLREEEFSVSKCVNVAGCRDIGEIALVSCF